MDRAYKLENIYESLLSKLQDLPNFTNETEQLLYDLFENEEPSNFIKVRVLDVINSIKGCGDWIPEWFIEDCRVNSLEDIFWRNYKDYSWIKLEVKKRKSIYSTYVYVDLEYIEERINIKFSS